MNFFKNYLILILLTSVKPIIGGQAVVDGVMMRSSNAFTIAVRLPNNGILIREIVWFSFFSNICFFRLPIFRGAAMLIESIYNGMSALQFSAEQAIKKEKKEKKKQKIIKHNFDIMLILAIIFSLFLGIIIFKGIPHFITFMFGEMFSVNGNSALPISSIFFHFIDGIIKILIFVSYILLISRLRDIKRLFMYHGAEHKAIHAFEKNLELNVKKTQSQSIFHPRCGTSLIVLVMVISIVFFSMFLPFLPVVSSNKIFQSLFVLFVKIPLMLPIAGIAYEFQKLAIKYYKKKIVRFFIVPGMLMQKLTTKEPENNQIEISLTALKKTIWREKHSISIENSIKKNNNAKNEIVEIFHNFENVCQRII